MTICIISRLLTWWADLVSEELHSDQLDVLLLSCYCLCFKYFVYHPSSYILELPLPVNPASGGVTTPIRCMCGCVVLQTRIWCPWVGIHDPQRYRRYKTSGFSKQMSQSRYRIPEFVSFTLHNIKNALDADKFCKAKHRVEWHRGSRGVDFISLKVVESGQHSTSTGRHQHQCSLK